MLRSFMASLLTLNRFGPGQSQSRSPVPGSCLDREANNAFEPGSWITATAGCPLAGRAQDDLAEGLGKLRAACERVGRSFDSLELAVIGLPPSEDLAERLLRIGFKHLIFSLPVGDAQQTTDDLDVRAELAAKLRAIAV